jgi:O-antigen/teichoic acid export membrane protein
VSIAMFAVPTLVTFWRHDLAALALSVALVRVTELCVLVAVSVRTFPEVFRAADIDGRAAGHLFRLGGWMTVSSVVGPVMMYFDRFVIAATVSAAAAAHYAAPYEVVTRLLVLPAALAGVLLPGFAARLRGSPASAAPLYGSGIRLAVLMVLLPVVAFVTLAPELLGLWLGPEFGEQGTLVLRLLSAGVLLNAGAQVPFALLHSVGRPDLTARLHLLELPFYLVILFPLITAFGIAGAAIAWMVRASVDALALFVIARRALPEVARMPAHGATLAALAAAGLAIGWSIEGLPAKIAFLAVYGAVSAAVAWWAILTPPERALARSPLKLLSGRSH